LNLLKKALTILLVLPVLFPAFPVSTISADPGKKNLKDEQQQFSRVRSARAEKEEAIKALFKGKGLSYPPDGILLIAYKMDKILELWASNPSSGKYILVNSYPICRLSGSLGPKRCEGDLQIPEGFYKIVMFNPFSNFHLSMMINYPNESDRKLGCKRPGGTIFIHGNCVTIGCIPITDELIKELYLICVDTMSSSRRNIPVYIFPARMTENEMKEIEILHQNDPVLINFWKNIKIGYNLFESTRKALKVSIDKSGFYVFEAVQ
jgi:murein L,D-transpeptidase YafK